MSDPKFDFLDLGAQTPQPEDDRQESEDPERELRLAAKAYYRLAPPYCVRFEKDGRVSLRQKRYEFWEKPDPAAATHWDVISYHPDLEDAERRLRHITSQPVYYDRHGRVTHPPDEPEGESGVPDEED